MITLYKKNKNGSIQTWTIEKGECYYTCNWGQLDGKMQTQITHIREGKQRRSVQEQVEFEMQSQIRGKKDEGYKSLEDLGIYKSENLYYILEPQSEKDTRGFSLQYMLDALLDKDATDANGNIKPMLSQPIVKTTGGKVVDNWKRVTYPIAGEPKLDGVRCLMFARKHESANLVYIQSLSREGKSYNFGTTKLREQLTSLFLDNPNVILDGELYVHSMPQNRISGAMRSGKYIPEVHDNMEYHVYDVINPDNTKINYATRRTFLEKLYMDFYQPFQLGESVILNSREEVDTYELKCIEDGYEGIMLKPLQGLYEIGKRSYNNLKVKQFLDEEFEITGYKLGKRGVQDLVFICVTKDGKVFEPTATGTIAQKQSYLDKFIVDNQIVIGKRLIIGKMATVKFKFYSEYGVPNHCQVKDIRDYE